MSSTPSTHASSPSSAASHGAPAHPSRSAGAAGTPGRPDLFSSLLALLSATHDATDLSATESEAAAEQSVKGVTLADNTSDQNPLVALLGWPGAMPQVATPNRSDGMSDSAPASFRSPASPSGNPAQIDLTRPNATTEVGPTATQGDKTGPGLDLQGMNLLDTPVAPDASTLAALGKTSPGESSTKPGAAGGETTARAAAWRNTVGAAHTNALQTAHTLPTVQVTAMDRIHSGQPTLVAQTRSTVALDERFRLTEISEAPLGATGSTPSASTGSTSGGQPQGGGSGSPSAAPEDHNPDALTERSELSNGDNTFSTSATLTQEQDEAHWGMPQLRHASLRVGEAGEDAIDIQLALSGQELNVEFRTDNSEARHSLAQEANTSLSDLLGRSGIQLGNVSVGSQNQQQGEPGRASAQPSAPARSRSALGGESAAASAPVEQLRRSDGSRPLDLFV